MGLFNLRWFKTNKVEEKQEELLDIQIRKEKMIADSLEKTLKDQEYRGTLPLQPSQPKPYKKIKFVNNVLTVIFNDGSVINKAEATVDDFNNVRKSTCESQIMSIIGIAEVETEKKPDDAPTYNVIKEVTSFPDFEIKEEAVYMNGIDRSLPPLLLNRFAEILSKYDKNSQYEENVLNDMEYTSLKKFWLKCCLNPNAQSAEDLYTFLTYHNLKIDRHGNFFAYRRVVRVRTASVNEKLVGLISGAYNNVKAVWKKKPSNYMIVDTAEGHIMQKVTDIPNGSIVGNLDTLYKNLPNMVENRYTDQHTHRMDYRVGQISSIPRDKCDDDNSCNCSNGIHAASKEYDYSGFGDTDILMIINPMDAVAVPLNEVGKLRVARFFFAMTLDVSDRYILDDGDFDVTELGDIFEEKCLENIEEHVHTSFAEEVKRHTFTIPQMSNVDIANISDMLKDMNEVIKGRVINQ